ncbi:hypothetical protein [Pelagerythrobacter marensis]|uniref:Uncharacterized protein n=1 Tax=Pelagerythrobacter marensis TaxID=543877 RepID=A0A0G3X9B0_9SPHN|nr:hypothetical protein [Pelagerythrobacter marensis]AKM07206.1 hypothetical protein AM2010_1131 [Pelagerythrobacter marensis]
MTRQTDNRETRQPVQEILRSGGELPAFTPVPRKCRRHDGWTETRQRRFIEALADTGSVDAACRAVNMSTVGAYHLRRQPGAGSFRAAWEAALALGVQRIEDVAMERALHGVEVPVYSYGKLVGTRRSYNDRLLMFMLRNRAPERFAEGRAKGMNAIGKMELERLKKEWRAEWEKEEDEALAGIDDRLEKMRERHLLYMSPRTRALHDAYETARQEDEANGYDPFKDPEHPVYIERNAQSPTPLPELPAPAEDGGDENTEAEPAPETGPRIRSLKDDGW